MVGNVWLVYAKHLQIVAIRKFPIVVVIIEQTASASSLLFIGVFRLTGSLRLLISSR